ncbi:hypothetical protein [Edaphobacter bradus]|uniref:hypothetical protein n=1 Tax=Edaphobacter bradus TaxID=2259016 RepID=UPI0021E0A742|nr:hypothetical protein [Edaphobacter bradus]
MQTIFQRGRSTQSPLWLKLIAVFCAFMVCVMGTVQVSHTHVVFSSVKQSPTHNSPSQDDHCPLCVAMHSSALPVSAHAPEPTLQMQALDSVAADAERTFRWRFEMASRPPPADAVRA